MNMMDSMNFPGVFVPASPALAPSDPNSPAAFQSPASTHSPSYEGGMLSLEAQYPVPGSMLTPPSTQEGLLLHQPPTTFHQRMSEQFLDLNMQQIMSDPQVSEKLGFMDREVLNYPVKTEEDLEMFTVVPMPPPYTHQRTQMDTPPTSPPTGTVEGAVTPPPPPPQAAPPVEIDANLVLHGLISDTIEAANIPACPTQWSGDHVQQFLWGCAALFSIALPAVPLNQLNGITILNSTSEQCAKILGQPETTDLLELLKQWHAQRSQTLMVMETVECNMEELLDIKCELQEENSVLLPLPVVRQNTTANFQTTNSLFTAQQPPSFTANSMNKENKDPSPVNLPNGLKQETNASSTASSQQHPTTIGVEEMMEIDEDREEKAPPATSGSRTHIQLWQFLKELLANPRQYGKYIRWTDRQEAIFRIEDSVQVAKLWGERKNRPQMNYDKLSRSIRQYYNKKIMQKTERSQRLVYQFCTPYGN